MTSTARSVANWRGPDGFFRFLSDVGLMVPSAKGGYEPYTPGPREAAEMRAALSGKHRTVVFCWPRRHGKTLASALIIVWRFLTRKTQNVAIVANSERQTTDTAFRLIKTIIEQTPYSRDMIRSGALSVTAERIEYPALGNIIQGFSSNPAALYGKKVTIAQISELHAATSDAVYQALASCTIDTDDGLVLVDSTVGPRSSPLFHLFNIHEQGRDPTLFFSYINYRDLSDAITNAPHWITPDALRSRAAQMLPQEFAQQHLNQWTSGTSALFPPEVVVKVTDNYRLDVPSITGGAAHVVGAGVDRAFGFSVHGDATVTTCVLKMLIGEDDHYFVLASEKVMFSSEGGIKRNLTRYHKDFSMSRAVLEQYNVQDIAAWCGSQPFEHEVISPTAERQANAFTTLFNMASEGRLHIHPTFDRLLAELKTFEYKIVSTAHNTASLPRFEAAKGCHDDHVYSLAWAIYALRSVELNPYEINGIHCHGPGPVPPLCVLNGGDLVPACADGCRSMRQARELYRAYRGRSPLCPVSFEGFVGSKLRNVGSHTLPR